MDDSIKRFKKRRSDRLKKRMDEEWITMHGTHVLIDDEGQVSKGPSNLKSVVEKSGGYKKKGSVTDLRKPNLGNVNKKPDNPSAGKYVDTLENGGLKVKAEVEKPPKNPVKPTMKGCTKASDSALQEMGGEHWDKSTPDTDVWEFKGKVSATSAATSILNGLRKNGYDAVFTTASGKVSEKPTGNIWVRDPKNDYNFVEYSVYKSTSDSAPGKTYLAVDKKITY